MVKSPAEPEFARPVVIEDIGPEGLEIEIEANPGERKRLGERFGLLSLDLLTARLYLAVSPSGVSVRVSGRFHAKFSQECVVSLEPVESDVDESLEAEFGPAAEEPVISLSLDRPEPPEPLADGRIDLGELVVQHMALALDPYPRKSGAALPDLGQSIDKEDKSYVPGPFSVLAALRKKDE
jgi:uncharacterized metal-binding protein YceD (DUF177 family)